MQPSRNQNRVRGGFVRSSRYPTRIPYRIYANRVVGQAVLFRFIELEGEFTDYLQVWLEVPWTYMFPLSRKLALLCGAVPWLRVRMPNWPSSTRRSCGAG